jgi:16S rRNA A1518/A1519 N6-dimethyltransferase RsmA/KsgA/DIM1 with predicted DNA glycosylase/AP lyase activity
MVRWKRTRPQPLTDRQIESLRKVINIVFGHRRKKISTSLRSEKKLSWDELLAGADISPDSRPEAVPVENWIRFAKLIPPDFQAD